MSSGNIALAVPAGRNPPLGERSDDRFCCAMMTVPLRFCDAMQAPAAPRASWSPPAQAQGPCRSFTGRPLTCLTTPKTITVTLGPNVPVHTLTVTSTDKSIATEVVPDLEKKQFRIIVRSTESGRPINAALKIEPDFPKESPKTYYANVRVDSRAVMPPK